MRGKSKAKGRRGSWFASVDGVDYPVLHSYWYKPSLYHDINMTPAFCEENGKRALVFIQALQSGDKAILAKSGPSNPSNTLEHFRRKGYIALYEYDFLSHDEDGLLLRLKSKVLHLK